MKKLTIIISSWLLDEVVDQARENYCAGVTVTESRDYGYILNKYGDEDIIQKPDAFVVEWLPVPVAQIVVSDDVVDYLINDIKKIVQSSRSGKSALIVEQVHATIRIRTGENNEQAL
jgi:nitrogen regulatory protein PII